MCGIAGVIGAMAPAADRIDAALATMANRGPDARGHAVYAVGRLSVTLLHTRLAIIDLDPRANQPFEGDGLALVYNGEVYNYIEVRRELEGLGHAFTTESDTEVLLRAWRQWGPDGLDRLEGMWAFALLDTGRGQLVLCRDRFGEKPLYTWRRDSSLYFASEIKTLAALAGAKPAVDTGQVRRYLVNGYKVLHTRPRTFFESIGEFPAAHVAELDLKGNAAPAPTPRPYWRLRHRPRAMTAEEALEGARERLYRSMAIRLRADVPLAFCLSGGIDSATLAAIATKRLGHRIHCFSVIDSDERYDERENIAAMVAWLGCEHFAVETSHEGFFERMRDLVAYHDAPVATISYYVHSFLSQAIADRGYKVAVSGTAADEVFTGYYDHYSMWLAGMKAAVGADEYESLLDDWNAGFGQYVQNPLLRDPEAFVRDPTQRDHILLDQDMFEDLLAKPFHEDFAETAYSDELLRNRMLNELFHEIVPVILEEDDRNSMLYSVENRSPYLDRSLAEFMFMVPSEHLIADGFAKRLLRQAGEGLVPDSVRLDKRKRGFNASIDSLINRDDSKTRDALLADGPIFDFIDRERFVTFLDEDMTPNHFSRFVFRFISSKIFLDHQRDWAP